MVGCRWTLLRCLFRYIRLVVCRVDVVNVSMKSAIARVCPKRVGCFGSSTRFQMRKVVGK
jgi:hypothetical protein